MTLVGEPFAPFFSVSSLVWAVAEFVLDDVVKLVGVIGVKDEDSAPNKN